MRVNLNSIQFRLTLISCSVRIVDFCVPIYFYQQNIQMKQFFAEQKEYTLGWYGRTCVLNFTNIQLGYLDRLRTHVRPYRLSRTVSSV
jgi:hypothetical protein